MVSADAMTANERRRARERERYATDPEFRAQRIRAQQERMTKPENKVKRNQWQRERYATDHAFRELDKQFRKARREANPEKYRAISRESARRMRRKLYADLPAYVHCLLKDARYRAEQRAIPSDVVALFPQVLRAIEAGRCEMTGILFEIGRGRNNWRAPSLDRINPELGYVPQNVRVVCYGMNAAMSSWGQDTLLEMVTNWIRTNPTVADKVRAAMDEATS